MTDAIDNALRPLDDLETDIVFHVVEGAIVAAHNLISSKRRDALTAAGVDVDDEATENIAGAINEEIRAYVAATVEDLDDEPFADNESPTTETAKGLLARAIRESGYGPALDALRRVNKPTEDCAGEYGLSICFLMDRALKIAGVAHRYNELSGA